MYKHKLNRAAAAATSSEATSERDSKYTVAEILSSMTDSARSVAPPITPVSFSEGVAPAYSAASTANLLTPTTLANLERSFDLAPSADNTTTTESGFIPPVVNPIIIDPSVQRNMPAAVKREYDPRWEDDMSSCSSTDPEWNPSTSKRVKKEGAAVPNIDPETYLMQNSRRPTGPRKERRNEAMSSEEYERRQVRRERNKLAAAKCRQRRVDQTNVLINETENLEEEKAELENEISHLMKQKDELQFVLDAHKSACPRLGQAPPPVTAVPSTMSYPMTRPSTLPLRTTQAPATTAPVSITTPSSGLSFNMGLEALIDGHTGLTPLTAGPPTCTTQHHRNSSDSDSAPNTSTASHLISL